MKIERKMESHINILLCDDHLLFREGLINLLKFIPEIDRVYEAKNGRDAIEIVSANKIDIVLMDLQMPIMNGFDTTRQLKKNFSHLKIIALSMKEDMSSILEIKYFGADGYIFKMSGFEIVRESILSVLKGETYFDKEIHKYMNLGFSDTSGIFVPFKIHEAIKGKERETLELFCDGYTAEAISEKLHIPKRTVEGIKARLFQKTGTSNIGGLVSYSIRNRIVF